MTRTMTTNRTRPGSSRDRPGKSLGLALVLALQAVCAGFFVYDIVASVLALPVAPIPWIAHELLEIGAALGLLLGAGLTAFSLRRAEIRRRAAEDRLAELSGAFHELVQSRFADWRLTPAERDVAFFVMKGFSTAEIAALRETSEGTVKAQTAAIYRKAEVSGRAQLMSLFIDDLMDDQLALAPPEEDVRSA